MRKTALVLAIVMLLTALAAPVMAAEARITSIAPEITFDGTTANCSVIIGGNNTSEKLEATMKLYRGSTLIATWTAEGNGYIIWSATKTVTRGYTYKLTVTLTVDGVACSPVYVTNTLS